MPDDAFGSPIEGVNDFQRSSYETLFENKKGRNDLVVDFFRKLSYNVKKYKSDWIAWYE